MIDDKREANLKIIAYKSPDGGKMETEIGCFTVDFNPSAFTVSNKLNYGKSQAKGQAGDDPPFEGIPPIQFSIDFTIDGTGAITKLTEDKKKDYVKNRITELRNVTGSNINGDIHRPNYLMVLWGTFKMECVLTSLNITYNLFGKDGVPLRAKVNCSFKERIAPDKGRRKSRLEPPDLTTYVSIKEGDVLPLIVKEKYNDPAYYMQVAKVNKLKNFRRILPGTKLVLPPMTDNDE